MVRKGFVLALVLIGSFLVEVSLIARFFVQEKTWGLYWTAVAGFTLLPITFTLAVRATKLQPTHKVIVITGIWVAWVVLAGIAAFATYFYWYNIGFSGNIDCGGGLCF